MKLSWIAVLFLLVLVAVFSVQNAAPITVSFLSWQFAMSAALIILLAAFLGVLIGLLIGAASRLATKSSSPETTQNHEPPRRLPPEA